MRSSDAGKRNRDRSRGSSQMAGMSGTASQAPASAASNAWDATFSQLIIFLSGFWGEVILIVSFALMAFGMWYGKKARPMILALIAASLFEKVQRAKHWVLCRSSRCFAFDKCLL